MTSSMSIVISAPSGAGKSTIIRALMKDDPRLVFSVSTTTRAPREGEIDGKNYYFVDKTEFCNMIDRNEFLEWAQVHSGYYGTSKKEVDRIWRNEKIPVFDVDVQGAKNLRTALPGAVFIFVMPPTVSTLAARLTGRNTEKPEELAIRLANASREMSEFAWYDYVILNDQLEMAVRDIDSIIRSESLTRDRMRRTVEKILEEKI